MTNPYSAAYPYSGGSYEEKCPKCNAVNVVEVTLQDGHNESEEYFCAKCGELLGQIRASLTPTTRVKKSEILP